MSATLQFFFSLIFAVLMQLKKYFSGYKLLVKIMILRIQGIFCVSFIINVINFAKYILCSFIL